jgi:hypothetical protein
MGLPTHELRRAAGMASLFLFAWPRLRDLLLWAKYLLVGSHGGSFAPVGVKDEQ